MNQKILVAWFSRADENYNVGTVAVGNTELLAHHITATLAEQGTTATEFAIAPSTPYPKDYQTCIAQASAELRDGTRPPYLGDITDFSTYTTIILGYPIWWGDLPPVVYTFLENHDFSGKNIAPFCTHEGSGQSGTFAKLAELLPNAKILPGFACTGSSARQDSGQTQIADWVKSLPLV